MADLRLLAYTVGIKLRWRRHVAGSAIDQKKSTKRMPMKAIHSTIVLGAALCASLLTGLAQAAAAPHPASYYGNVARAEAADRQITIAAGTTSVNVTNGETVTFVIGEQRFTFSFQTWSNTQTLDLAAIAPADIKVPAVRVYVAGSPLYQN